MLGVVTGVSFQPGRRFGQREVALYGEHAAVMAALVEQGRRLDAIGGLQAGVGIAAPGTANLEKEIVNRFARLVSDRPGRSAPTARLLEAIEALVSPGRR